YYSSFVDIKHYFPTYLSLPTIKKHSLNTFKWLSLRYPLSSLSASAFFLLSRASMLLMVPSAAATWARDLLSLRDALTAPSRTLSLLALVRLFINCPNLNIPEH